MVYDSLALLALYRKRCYIFLYQRPDGFDIKISHYEQLGPCGIAEEHCITLPDVFRIDFFYKFLAEYHCPRTVVGRSMCHQLLELEFRIAAYILSDALHLGHGCLKLGIFTSWLGKVQIHQLQGQFHVLRRRVGIDSAVGVVDKCYCRCVLAGKHLAYGIGRELAYTGICGIEITDVILKTRKQFLREDRLSAILYQGERNGILAYIGRIKIYLHAVAEGPYGAVLVPLLFLLYLAGLDCSGIYQLLGDYLALWSLYLCLERSLEPV